MPPTKCKMAPSQRRRHQRQMLGYLPPILVAVVVFCAIYFLQLYRDLRFGADVFYPGTYINGVSVAGMRYEEAQKKLSEQADAVFEGTVFTLRYGERTWQASTAQFGAKLEFGSMLDQAWSYAREGSAHSRRALVRQLRKNPIVLAAEPEYDHEMLHAFVEGIKAEIDRPAVEAEIIVVGFEQLKVTQSQQGLALDAEALEEQLVNLFTTGQSSEIEITPTVIEPRYTTEALAQATQKLSGLSTSTKGSSSDRTHNIRLALSNFNALCVPAGETVSFNEVVGVRSLERGYKSAAEYAGTSVQVGYGGGVCQASSTLYANLVYSGIAIVQRSPHNMTVGYTKPSLDAAVADVTNEKPKDLVFTNDTGYPLYFFTNVTDEKAYVSIFGKPSPYEIQIVSEVLERDIKSSRVIYKADNESRYVYYDNETVKASDGKPGMRSQAWRKYLLGGEIVATERLSVDTYEAQPDVYWRGIHTR